MPRWTRKPEPQLTEAVWSLTAATRRIDSDDARRERAAGTYGWQLRALSYSDQLGEIWYAAKFYERALRNLTLLVQQRQPDGTWRKVDTGPANDLLATLVDANGETSGLLGMYGRLIFLTGEARLFGQTDPDTGTAVWEMLSVEEIHVNDQGQYLRKKGPGEQPETIQSAPENVFSPTGDAAVMFRLWSPSPRYSDVADSPMRACLDICEELLLLTRSVRGEIKSRLSNNGLMGIPSELQLPATQQGQRPDEDPGADNLMARLTKAMQTGIQDESSASAMIPIIIRGPGELLKQIVHFRFDKPTGEEAAKRDECVKRLAMSLDMPPEALLGIGDTNHWGAWQIDESSWKVHIQPVAQTLVENLTSAWFRPMLGDADYRIWYDESEVVNHPDRSSDYKDANDRYVLSNKAYLTAIGAQDTDAMDPAEQDRMAQLKALAHRGSDATATPPAGSAGAGGAESPAAAASTDQGPPSSGPPSSTQPTAAPDAGRALTAAELAVWRCREIAGSRLRSKVDRDRFRSISNCDLAYSARGETVDFQEPDALVAGGGALFQRMLSAWGTPTQLAEQIVTAAEEHAALTLFDENPMPLPDELVALCTLGSLSGTPS